MPAPLQDVGEAYQVRVDVGVRVLERVAHPCLRREVHDDDGTHLSEQLRHGLAVGDVQLAEGEARPAVQQLQPRPLQARVVVVVHAVDADDLAAFGQQPLAQVVADEAGGTRD
jgi:hypothetical protein